MIPVINLLSEVKFRLPKIFVYFILIWFRKIVNIGKYRSEIREALTNADLDAARDQLTIDPVTYHPDLQRIKDLHE
jgi:hypothetical protein